jgi:hypothetical protein
MLMFCFEGEREMTRKKTFALVLTLVIAMVAIAADTGHWSLERKASKVRIDANGQIRLEPRSSKGITFTGPMEYAPAANYSGTGSFQPVAADLTLAAAAGGTSGKFLSPMMGNIYGTNLSKSGNYISGLIGALSVDGTRATELQVGGVLGIVMDASTGADGAVVAVIDGSDPSSVTRANAAFAARMNNNNAGSGVDYGVDLYDAGRSSGLYSGGGQPLKIAKADVRMTNEVCILNGAGAPTDGTSGTGVAFAGPGSLYIDRTAGKIYINTNTKASPTWTVVGSQS